MAANRFILPFIAFGFVPFLGAKDFPPPPPVYTPEETQRLFEFAEPGFRIELVASEPMVQDPVAIDFDGEGRLWVVEMRGYMPDIKGRGEREPVGRISVLEDTDRDGRMDRSVVFLDELVLPRAISVHPDGVLVAEFQKLWWVRDTDGDLVADERELVDPNYAGKSIEHSSNGLLRALDNWIYNAKEGHRYRRIGDGWVRDKTEPRGQWGISQDDYGRLFYSYNHSQLHTDFVPPNAFMRNPDYEAATGVSAGVTTTNQIFPIRPTLAANRGYIPGALDDQGRIKEFTSACGPLIYRGDAFPEGFRGNSFVCDTVGNLVKRSVLTDDGVRVFGRSAYPDRDFLASKDERFRPSNLAMGPDGGIYIVDIYRGVVQHHWFMSPYLEEISRAREMDRPIHLGRIWRVVPEDFEHPEPPRFGEMDADELVATLAHPSGWWRDRAQMHLVERGLTGAIPALRQMVLEHEDPLARLHALWTLEGLGDPEPASVVEALRDDDPRVQAAALRVLTRLGLDDVRLAGEIESLMTEDMAEPLALQIILTLGDLAMDEGHRARLLVNLAVPRAVDPMVRDAVISSLSGREVGFVKALKQRVAGLPADPSLGILVELIGQTVVRGRNPAEIEALAGQFDMTPEGFGWFDSALMTGIAMQGSVQTENPVALSREPAVVAAFEGNAAETVAALERYFAWPGHEPSAKARPRTDVRPLTSEEREQFVRGRQVYQTSCFSCHGADGEGIKLVAPPLAGSDWALGSPQRLTRVMLHGLTGPITVSGKRYAAPEVQPLMPALAALDNDDVAAVLTYIRRAWGNTADPVPVRTVKDIRIEAQGRTTPWTEAELLPYAESSDS